MSVWRIAAVLLLVTGGALPLRAESATIFGIFWEGCEHGCAGFIGAIEASGYPAEVVVRDASQSRDALPDLVAEAREMGADLILTYGTNVTLGVIGRITDRPEDRLVDDLPVVFMYVADPFGTGIASDFDGSGRDNVAGTFNRVPEEVNLRIIRSIRPDFETLGILYNGNEANSVNKVAEMQRLAKVEGFGLVAVEIDPGNADRPDPALIPAGVEALAEADVDFVYVGSSSFLRVNGEIFTAAAVEAGLPVLSPYEELVRENHALLSVAARASDVGRVAAEQALRILRDGAVPGELPIARVTDYAYVVNIDVGRRLALFPPIELMQVAETVGN